MRIISTLAVLVATTTSAAAETSERLVASATYVGVGGTLTNGINGKSEFGGALAVAPLRNLELEVGAIRHDVDGHEGLDFHQVWLATAAARAKLPLRRGALFVGFGVITGEHASESGCTATGFINFCGDANDTFVYRHWDRAVWLTPEVGGEVALGPVAMRMSLAPVIDVSPASDFESGCRECESEGPNVVFNVGIHGRVPMF